MSTIGKAINVLSLVAESRPAPRFTDLLEASGHPKATLHRLLGELMSEGLVALDERTQSYRLGLRLLELAHHSWSLLDLRAVAADEVDALSRDTDETVHLAMLDDAHIVYIDKRESARSLRLYSAIGKRVPLYCTGVGKAILAFVDTARRERLLDATPRVRHTPNTITERQPFLAELEAIRQRGYALDMEEHEEGVRCVAAAIVNRDGQAIGGISLTGPTMRLQPERLAELAPRIVDSAARISRNLAVIH